MAYEYKTIEFRAQCVRVIDGDTVDMVIDRGFRDYRLDRFRLYGIDTPEMNDKDPAVRLKAVEARDLMQSWLQPSGVLLGTGIVRVTSWPLRIVTYKDPDNFGRWLVDIYMQDAEGKEFHVNQELLARGLAVPYRR